MSTDYPAAVANRPARCTKFSSNVWVDTTWLATASHSAAKRAFLEWLETIPADRLMFGADSDFPEEIYGSVIVMRRCLAEVLAEKVEAGEIEEDYALKMCASRVRITSPSRDRRCGAPPLR